MDEAGRGKDAVTQAVTLRMTAGNHAEIRVVRKTIEGGRHCSDLGCCLLLLLCFATPLCPLLMQLYPLPSFLARKKTLSTLVVPAGVCQGRRDGSHSSLQQTVQMNPNKLRIKNQTSFLLAHAAGHVLTLPERLRRERLPILQ